MIKLSKVLDGLEMVSDEMECYYNPETEEIFLSNIGEFEELNEDELEQLFETSYRLPTKYDIYEYHMIEEFVQTIKDESLYHLLLDVIHGKKVFRKFKDTCINAGIIEDWYHFREQKYKEIALEWCTENKIGFEDDVVC